MAKPSRIRSLLFAPAVRPDLIKKMPATGADAIVIDLEDATPPDSKAEGRARLNELPPHFFDSLPVFVRINDSTTPWYADDLASLPPGLAGIVVPKIESHDALDRLAGDLIPSGLGGCMVIGGVETALGVADARELVAHRVLDAAYFGAEDFIADMGGMRTSSNAEVLYARSQVALAGRLAKIATIDQIVSDFGDDERFHRESKEARSLGFAGKLCIHPAQVVIANDCFTPSAAEVDHAERLLAAYRAASAAGVASIAFEGQMVDEPVAARARHVLLLVDDAAASLPLPD